MYICKKTFKGIKKSVKIALIALATFFVLLLTPTILLSFSEIQNIVVDKITQSLERELHTKVSIDRVKISNFNHLKLKDFYLEDQNGDLLAKIDDLDLRISLWALLGKELKIPSVALTRLEFHLKTAENGTSNIDFLKDLFANDRQSSDFDFDIRSVKLRDCAFSLTQTNVADSLHGKPVFQSQHVDLHEINTKIIFHKEGDHNFSGEIRRLSFKEHSGFELTNFSTSFACNDTLFSIPKIVVELPKSSLVIGKTELRYPDWETLVTDFQKVKFSTSVEPSHIALSDLKAFSKPLANFRQEVNISGKLAGSLENIKATDWLIKMGENIRFEGKIQLTGLPQVDETFIFADVKHLDFNAHGIQDIVANLSKKPTVLPHEFSHLGQCSYKGQMTGFLSNIVAYGKLKSGIGTISTDVSLQLTDNMQNLALNGKIRSKKLNIGAILPKEAALGEVSFDTSLDLVSGNEKKVKGALDFVVNSLEFRSYNYKNIRINGELDDRNFIGKINLDDENIKFDFVGDVNLNASNFVCQFDAKLSDFRPNALHLTEQYEDLSVSLQLSSDFKTHSSDKIDGVIFIDSLRIANDEMAWEPNRITLTSESENQNKIRIDSELLSGFLSGDYSFETLGNSFVNAASQSFPIVKTLLPTKKTAAKNNLKFFIEIEDTETLCDVLEVPWSIGKHSHISGFLNDSENGFGIDCHIDKLQNEATAIDNINVKIRNENAQFSLLANAATRVKNDTLAFFLDLDGLQDTLTTHFEMENSRTDVITAGELYFETHFWHNGSELITDIQIFPTDLVIDNKTWSISPADISTNFKQISLRNFGVRSDDDQSITFDGIASKNETDKIDISLNDISLDYINSLTPADEKGVEFGGRVSGAAAVYSALAVPAFDADVVADNFIFNHSNFGKAHATATFDFEKKSINFYGVVTNNDEKRDTTAILDGAYFLLNDSLDIHGDARNLDLQFLSYYLYKIFDNVQGKGTGHVYIHGQTKAKTVVVEVDAKAQDALLRIDALKSSFTFSDTVKVTPTEIIFNNIELQDLHGNKGKINGVIHHKYFQNMDYRLDIDCNNMLVLNTTKADNSSFYGSVFATGKAIIQGNDDATNIIVNAQTAKNSRFIVPLNNSSAAQNKFITFVGENEKKKPKIEASTSKKNRKNDNAETATNVRLHLNVTPDADIQLHLNAQSGDMIRATGLGNVQVDYSSVGEKFSMLGDYEIETGSYTFTFQNALRKEFKVESGRVSWSGVPDNPNIELRAYYQLTASLRDILDESILNKSNRTTVPVQCVLLLSGTLNNPVIKFELNLPNSDEELNRALDAVVNTEEMMNRQIISLLFVGKFYAPELLKNNPGMVSNDILAIVSSTLSTQLNNIFSQIFEKWNFGVNFRTTGSTSTQDFGQEYEFNFLYMPTDRVSLNGNIGYRNDNLNTSNFIGDLDFEYKLIQSGKLSLKVYTHTNDYNEFKTGLTTQGVGFVYKENFGTAKELFANWKKSLTPPTPEERAAENAAREKEKAQKKATREWRRRERAEAQARIDAEKKAQREAKKEAQKKEAAKK